MLNASDVLAFVVKIQNFMQCFQQRRIEVNVELFEFQLLLDDHSAEFDGQGRIFSQKCKIEFLCNVLRVYSCLAIHLHF